MEGSKGLHRKIFVMGDEMKKEVLKKFRKMFEEQKKGLIYNDKIMREDFHSDENDRMDEVDQASTDQEQSLRLRLRNRESLYMKKLEEAIRRIDAGDFGCCESCDGPIELKRLEARPTATLCIACKEEEEQRELLTADGRKSKSMGAAFSRATG